MTTYNITEVEEWNPDETIEQMMSVKDLINSEFNDESDNIARNLRILELMNVRISRIESALKGRGLL